MEYRANTNANQILQLLLTSIVKVETETRLLLSPRITRTSEEKAILTLQLTQCQIVSGKILNPGQTPLQKLMDIIIFADQILSDEKTQTPAALKNIYTNLLQYFEKIEKIKKLLPLLRLAKNTTAQETSELVKPISSDESKRDRANADAQKQAPVTPLGVYSDSTSIFFERKNTADEIHKLLKLEDLLITMLTDTLSETLTNASEFKDKSTTRKSR